MIIDRPKSSIFILVSIIILLILVLTDLLLMSNETYDVYDIIVEAHGLFFDLIVFGILITFYEEWKAKKDDKLKHYQKLQLLSGIDTDYAKVQNMECLNKLIQYKIDSIYVHNSFLKNTNTWESGILKEWNFYNCNLQYATFKNMEFHHCSFKGSLLSGADFYNCKLVDVKFDTAQLEGLKMVNCEIRLIELQMAYLNKDEYFLKRLQEGNNTLDQSIDRFVIKKITEENSFQEELEQYEDRIEDENLLNDQLYDAIGKFISKDKFMIGLKKV